MLDCGGGPEPFDLEGRVVAITGASMGIGRAIAFAAHRHGAHVVLLGRRRDRLDAIASDLGGDRVTAQMLEITAPESVGRVAVLLRELDGVCALVNSAGLPATRPALEQDVGEWESVLAVNLTGTFLMCQAVAPLMIERSYGKIVNISSTWSLAPAIGKAAYGAAKAGINQLTRILALEWADHGIRVNAIAPTLVATESRKGVLETGRAQEIVSRIPLGRAGHPDDVAQACLFLLSSASDFVTGSILNVDGGRLLS